MGEPVIALRGTGTAALTEPLQRSLWRLVDSSIAPAEGLALLTGSARPPVGYGMYVRTERADAAPMPGSTITLPAELDHLSAGDVISLSEDATKIKVLWRTNSNQNSILLTERCDNYCLMCSQPPRDVDDDYLIDRAFDLISMLPAHTTDLLYTGGEPTLYGDRLLRLLDHTLTRLPAAEVHLLSNGRRFSDDGFARAYGLIAEPRLMVGIPLYGAEHTLHEYVVQADGAFNETVRGIMNLAALGQSIEIRVVIHKQTAPALVDIAEFIARNLPFVNQVALMGLEIMGLARANLTDVWIDPWDYKTELAEAAQILDAAHINTMIYNHQLCLLDPTVWHLAVRSISDWKNEYLPVCEGCTVRDLCGGFFHSAKYRTSAHLQAVPQTPAPPTAAAAAPSTPWQGYAVPISLPRGRGSASVLGVVAAIP